jgi:hypothetical protein
MKLHRHERWLLSGALSIFIICALLTGAGIVFLQQSGTELLTTLAAQKGIVLAIDRWNWSSCSSFELHKVWLGPEGEILPLEHLTLRWDWVELSASPPSPTIVGVTASAGEMKDQHVLINENGDAIAQGPYSAHTLNSEQVYNTVDNIYS